jgi:hypothetical protein
MTRDDIDLMVARLAGFWPSQDLRLNTTKDAWAKSDVLQRLSSGGGKQILNEVKNERQFPSLGHVEAIARRLLKDEFEADCGFCKGNGYYYPPETLDAAGLRRLDIVVGVKRCPNCYPVAVEV